MVLTVTLNAALDITYRVGRLRPHSMNRPDEVLERAGGKGINAARVLAALGHEAVVTGFAGGGTGDRIRAELAGADRITEALIPIAGTTRRTVAVVEAAAWQAGGGATVFSEPGPRFRRRMAGLHRRLPLPAGRGRGGGAVRQRATRSWHGRLL